MVDYYDEWFIVDLTDDNGSDGICAVPCPQCGESIVLDVNSNNTESDSGEYLSNDEDKQCRECGKYINVDVNILATETKQK